MPDQYSSFDVARLSMDGANAGTTFSDSLGHTFTAAGAGVTTSTANAKFGSIAQGNASLLSTGVSTAYISSATTADWNMGSGDFCVDMWVYPTAYPTDPTIDSLIFSIANGSGTSNIGMALTAGGILEGWTVVGGSQKMLLSGPKRVRLNRWSHIALVRTSGTLTLYVNGFAEAKNTTLSTTAVSFSSDLVYIANSPSTLFSGFVGHIDDFRITKGQARWTSNFVLPIANFNTSSPNIAIQSVGTFTKQIVINGEADHNAVMEACIRTITTMGWDFFDIKNDRGQNIAVFRSLNKDGVSYKYALLIQNQVCQHICVTSCEYWDKNSQTILNECFSGNRQVYFQYYAYNTTIQIMASNRWLLAFSYVLDSPSTPAGVIEMEREAPEDVPNGIPCWAYWCTELHYNYTTNWGPTGNIYPPRTFDGRTGQNAGQYQTIMYSTGAYGQSGNTNGKWSSFSMTNTSGMGRYGWDTSKINITHFRLQEHNNVYTTTGAAVAGRGRYFGIKGIPSTADHLERITIPCDSDNFFSPGGTDKEHWVFSPGQRVEDRYAWTSSPRFNAPKVSNYLPGVATTDGVFNGRALYLAGSADVNKIDLVTGVTSVITVPGVPLNLVTDGRFVYGTTNSAGLEVFRIDTLNNDNVLSVATGTTTHSITWDGQDRVIASKLADGANAVLYFINTFSMTTMQTVNLSNKFTTSGHIQGLASNGKGISVGCSVNATTNTDCQSVVIDDDAMTAGWGIGPPTLLANSMCARWDGYTWLIGYTSVTNGNQGAIQLQPEANGHWTNYLQLINTASVGTVTYTANSRVNAYREAFKSAWVYGARHWRAENSWLYNASAAPGESPLGTYVSPFTDQIRWGYNFGNNMIVYQSTTNNVEILRNLIGARGSDLYSHFPNQFLLPK